LLATGLLTLSPGNTAELMRLDVSRDKSLISVAAALHIDAPIQGVYERLSDYDGLAQMSQRFREARVESQAPDGSLLIYTRVEGCVWFFCRDVERYARLQGNGTDRLEATVQPEGSDFEYGYEQWQLIETSSGTTVEYSHELRPKFWVPPVIGMWVIERALRSDALTAAQRLEWQASVDSAENLSQRPEHGVD
jgi:hypothetical protein